MTRSNISDGVYPVIRETAIRGWCEYLARQREDHYTSKRPEQEHTTANQ